MLVAGHLGVAVAGAIPLFTETMLAGHATFGGIAVAVIVATVFGTILGGAMDYFLKTYLPEADRARYLAALNSTTQITLIAGTAFGGLVVSQGDSSHAFLVISASGVFLAALCWWRMPILDVARDTVPPAWKRGVFSAGPMLYLKHRRLFAIAACAALAFSIGQITNTLLPALVGVHLHGTGIRYSMIEAAWSAGALIVGVWLARFSPRSAGTVGRDAAIIGAMAVVLAAVPYLSAFPALLVMHFLLGVGFALVRIRSETRFLAECPLHLLGRFRANSSFLTGSVGLLIFATPTLHRGTSVANLYGVLAGAVIIAVIGLMVWCASRQASYSANKSGPNTS